MVEPLTAERIEVVRGPAGLLYGSSNALGGVINVIREEVPRTRLGSARRVRKHGGPGERLAGAAGDGHLLSKSREDRARRALTWFRADASSSLVRD